VTRLEDLSFGELLLVLALLSAASMAIFAHASKHGSRHATAWGVATFLAAAIAVPLYFLNYWLSRRRR
jgi:hypothetical protein